MPDPDPVVLKPGARLRSAVCTTEVARPLPSSD